MTPAKAFGRTDGVYMVRAGAKGRARADALDCRGAASTKSYFRASTSTTVARWTSKVCSRWCSRGARAARWVLLCRAVEPPAHAHQPVPQSGAAKADRRILAFCVTVGCGLAGCARDGCPFVLRFAARFVRARARAGLTCPPVLLSRASAFLLAPACESGACAAQRSTVTTGTRCLISVRPRVRMLSRALGCTCSVTVRRSGRRTERHR